MAEKPFCDTDNAGSIDVALYAMEFHFLHLRILLTRCSSQMHEQCLDASRRMLLLLRGMAPESRQPYHPIIWQLICCPFTPFFILFRELISKDIHGGSEENGEALAAMDRLPGYLRALSSRNPLAADLENIAIILIRRARLAADWAMVEF